MLRLANETWYVRIRTEITLVCQDHKSYDTYLQIPAEVTHIITVIYIYILSYIKSGVMSKELTSKRFRSNAPTGFERSRKVDDLLKSRTSEE